MTRWRGSRRTSSSGISGDREREIERRATTGGRSSTGPSDNSGRRYLRDLRYFESILLGVGIRSEQLGESLLPVDLATADESLDLHRPIAHEFYLPALPRNGNEDHDRLVAVMSESVAQFL